MKTSFTREQLADPATAASEKAIRTCVHCGFCTATCPTYVLLGDERDSPRGRIYLMQQMLEQQAKPTREVVTHIDRCLSCLGCETTCPSGVEYRRLVDHARAYVEDNHRRGAMDRWIRWALAKVLPYRQRFAAALALGRLASPLAGIMNALGAKRMAAMMQMAGASGTSAVSAEKSVAAGAYKGRVILQGGCIEPVLRPGYQAAAARLITRAGYEVVRAPGEGCCGSLVHHLGREVEALGFVRKAVDVWSATLEAEPVDAIIVTVSGCGTTIKDYGFLLRNDPAYAARAARISALAKDISEFLPPEVMPPVSNEKKLRVAWHSPCSLQHGQKILSPPKPLLERAGFEVVTPAEAHMCCGSAGTYSILQPEIADELGRRKAKSLEALKPDVIATANIGCAVHVGARTGVPVVHIAELLDWATGGPAPAGLDRANKAVLGSGA
jgi:glycolate oxidase iron-sulfur subunit